MDCLELLETIKSENIQLELSGEGESAIMDIDCHFYDLTPLNTNTSLSKVYRTPLPEAWKLMRNSTSVIAVNDIGDHAIKSWTSRDTCKMSLKDFLPDDVNGVLIMSYGYNSSLYDETTDGDFLDYRRHLL
jgi:hypothetical protein